MIWLLWAHMPPFNEAAFGVIVAALIWCVKFLGYYLAALWLRPRYREVEVSPVFFAALRALVGLSVGLLYYATAFPKATWWNENPSPLPWYGALTWLRLLEWVAVLWLFFGRHVGRAAIRRIVAHAILGTAWSVFLDFVVAVLAIPAVLIGFAAG